jgi:hypothetical protein
MGSLNAFFSQSCLVLTMVLAMSLGLTPLAHARTHAAKPHEKSAALSSHSAKKTKTAQKSVAPAKAARRAVTGKKRKVARKPRKLSPSALRVSDYFTRENMHRVPASKY